MKIGFLSPLVPSVAYGHRPHSFLHYLVDRGHQVVLRAIDDPGPVPDAAADLRKRGIEVRLCSIPRPRRWWNCAKGLPGRLPLRVLHCQSVRLEKELLEDLRAETFDILHIDRFRLAPYATLARQVFPGPIVLDFPDALSLYYQRAIENPRHWAKAWIDRREHRVMPAYEKQVLEGDFEAVVCSEVDRSRLLERCPKGRIAVIPNMVDVEEFRPRDRSGPEVCATFTGTLYYLPNIDGLLWLQQNILPLLADTPLRVEVLGFGATSELDPVRADPRFRFHGYVENMAEHLFKDDIYLCPLRVGAGVRFKLLEAFSAGMATVSTTLGYEGIPCTPGRHLLVADTERDFAEAIRRLLEDPEERHRIGRNARAFALDKYSSQAAGRGLESLYEESLRRA